MPSIRVIAGAAIGSLFVCGLFSGQGVAQTATESVDKLMQLLQPMNPDKSEKNRPIARRPSTRRGKLLLRRKSVRQLSPPPKKAP